MKKKLFGLLLCFCASSYAQDEIKVNITDALALKTLTLSYEHYATERTSVGLSGLFNFEDESSNFRYKEDQMYTAFVRHYFSSESLWNLFGELFIAYNSGDDERSGGTVIDYSDGALGLSIGYKYISPGGFTVDIHGGLGRNMFSEDSPTIVPRIGVNIGFQF